MNDFNTLKKQAMERFFEDLNDMQRKAVFNIDGPLLILAGAGSGKTTVLINRIANMIYFGDAYTYNDEYPHSDEDIVFLKNYIDGLSDDHSHLASLINHRTVNPWNILAITFTNKAAKELKDRLVKMLGDQGESVRAATFHSACSRILRAEADRLGYKSSFTIYDTDDSLRLIKGIIKELGLSDKIFPPRLVLSVISSEKNKMVSPEDYYKKHINDVRDRDIAKMYKLYNERLMSANAMDFDDILVNTVKLLEQFDDVLDHYQNLYKYILVDEYQDTNHVQYKLIDLLAAKNGNICVVGDDDQSIYKFRGATIENILNFEDTFACDPENDVIRLEQNYRSTQNILTTANALISHNKGRKGKTLWTDFGDGEKVTDYLAVNERSEAKAIAKIIKENKEKGIPYNNNAILYRMNAQSNIIEQTFIREEIPYIVFGGLKFYDRKEIKDVISYLAVINNPTDRLRFRRIINEPKRGIGDATITAIEQISSDLGEDPLEVLKNCESYAPIAKKSKILLSVYEMFNNLRELSETVKPSELLDEVLKQSGYADMLSRSGEEGRMRLDNIAELKSTLINYEDTAEDPTLEGFLEEISLYTDIDKYDESEDYVALMTIHSAKGLEFDNVFVAGMEENVFPSARSFETEEDLEEERRLAYVAITRAKKKLYLMHSAVRMLYGRTSSNRPSRFLSELPEDTIEHIKEDPPILRERLNRPQRPDYSHESDDILNRRKNSLSKTSSGGSFKVGDVVKHPNPKFGKGVIISCESMGGDTLLEIAFDSCGTKKIMSNFVKLKKLDDQA